MKRPLILTVLAIAAGVAVAPAIVTSADAQVPPRNGAWGDRDRDGVPNAFDQYNNNRQQAWGDRTATAFPMPTTGTTTASRLGATETVTAFRTATTGSTIASCRTGTMTAFRVRSTGTTAIPTARNEQHSSCA